MVFVKGHTVTEENKKAVRKRLCGKTGEGTPHWKNGRYTNSKGYVLIYKPEHPNAYRLYVPEHRLVVEEELGRYLTTEEIVHHINGIKHDNRSENLWVFDRKEHRAMHHDNPFRVVVELYNRGVVGFDGKYFIR